MRVNKRTLVVFNVEYEMQNDMGKMVTWKANVLCSNNHKDATDFIAKYIGKPINVLSIGKIVELDGVSDDAIEFIVKGSGFQVAI